MVQIDLSEFCKTKAQATDFNERISTISQGVYKTDFDLHKALLEEFGITKRELFLKILREQHVASNSAAGLKDFFTKLIALVNGLPVLKLSIAFEPKDQTLKTLSDWFYINVKKQVIFDVTVDTSLIAGAVIMYQGKFFDFSVKKTFEQIVYAELHIKPVNPISESAHSSQQTNSHQSIEQFSIAR